MSLNIRVTAALSCVVSSLILASTAAAQVVYTTPLAKPAAIFHKQYNQGPDELLVMLPSLIVVGVNGVISYNGLNRAYVVLENDNAFVRVEDNTTLATSTTDLTTFGIINEDWNVSWNQLAISDSGLDVAFASPTNQTVNQFYITSDSGLTWSTRTLPPVTHLLPSLLTQEYDLIVQTVSSGLLDVNFQPSMVWGHESQPKLHVFIYQEASAPVSGNTGRVALIEHVFTPGNPTATSRVIFVGNAGPDCTGSSCYINVALSDTRIVLVAGAGEIWTSGSLDIDNNYHPRYAIIETDNSTGLGTVHSGWIGEGESPVGAWDGVAMDQIALSYMGVEDGKERFAFLRSHGGSGVSYGVSAIPIEDSGGSLSFTDTYPYPLTNTLTTLNSSDLALSFIGTTSLAPVLAQAPVGANGRELRDIAAKRDDSQGRVVVFLFGKVIPFTTVSEGNDVRSVTFVPGSPITSNMAKYVNDYKKSDAVAQGKLLDIAPDLFNVVSHPNGKVGAFFTGSRIPAPTNPLEGRAYFQWQ